MANPLVTPNMFLTEPVVGGTLSPAWASDLNANFGILDQHNHEPGSGVQIPPAGLNINSDLTFQGNNATNLRTTRYVPISLGSLTGTDLGVIVVDSAGDLYYVNEAGLQIQITNSSGIVGTPGSISGLVSPASASYVSATGTFVWQQNSGVAANMDAATYLLRYPGSYPTPTGNYIALAAPSTLATGYFLTFPAALPSTLSFVTESSSGQLAYISASGGITGSMIAAATITGSNIAANTISGSNIVSSVALAGSPSVAGSLTVGGDLFLPSTLVFTANNVQLVSQTANTISIVDGNTSSNYPIVTSAPGISSGLVIIRGTVTSTGGVLEGEGFTASGSGGSVTITFTTPFFTTPVVVASAALNSAGSAYSATVVNVGSGSCLINTFLNNVGAAANFSFIAMGPRNG